MSPRRPRDADHTPRRLFAHVQAGKGLVGLLLGAGFVVLIGRPDMFELAAMAALVMPLVLALASFTSLRLTILEQAGLALSAMLIGYLCYLTGGLGSPLMVWLVLVPAEAALAGGRQAVTRAGFAAALVLAALALVQMLGYLPVSRLPMPAAGATAAAILAALVQAGLIATAAQDRQRAADRAAAHGAAMYQLLADNAVDLITRHAPDGRIRFASPASIPLLRPDTVAAGRGDACRTGPSRRSGRARNGVPGIGLFRARKRRRSAAAAMATKQYVWAEIRCRPTGVGERRARPRSWR